MHTNPYIILLTTRPCWSKSTCTTLMYTHTHCCILMYTDVCTLKFTDDTQVHWCTLMFIDLYSCTLLFTHAYSCSHIHVHWCTLMHVQWGSLMYAQVHPCTLMHTHMHSCDITAPLHGAIHSLCTLRTYTSVH